MCMMHLSFPSIITVIQGATRETQARQSSFDPLLQQHFSQCFLDDAADEIRNTKAGAAAPNATKDEQSNGLAAAACKSRLEGVPPIISLTATTNRCSLCRMLSVYARYMLDICRYMLDICCVCLIHLHIYQLPPLCLGALHPHHELASTRPSTRSVSFIALLA